MFGAIYFKCKHMCKSGFMQEKTRSGRTHQYVLLIVGLVLLSIITSTRAIAQGNLLITPRRVVFEGQKRTQDLNLANTGIDTAKYNVSVINYRMREDGSFEEITTPDAGQNFADKFLRFFPRTVTLAPNEAQVVKMQVTKSDQLSPGEYRSHVYFRAVPKQTALGTEETKKDSISIGVKLIPIFGITIPVIIRVGESTTKVTLTDLKLDIVNDTIPRLQFAFNRTGNMSVYGDIVVEHISPTTVITQVGTVRGIAVYTPNSVRRFQMELDKKAKVDFHSGNIKITYNSQSDTKTEKYTEAVLPLH
jgi:P pilus assembly chaperone PapD